MNIFEYSESTQLECFYFYLHAIMIISPLKIAWEGILSNILNDQEQIQQNGIDLTLASIAQLDNCSENELLCNKRSHCVRTPMNIIGPTLLQPGVYEVLYNEEFNIPNWMCAYIYTRSTLVRGGSYLASGLYDAGFKGKWWGVLHISIPTWIEKDIRIGQVVFFQSEEGKMYDGIYNQQTSIQ